MARLFERIDILYMSALPALRAPSHPCPLALPRVNQDTSFMYRKTLKHCNFTKHYGKINICARLSRFEAVQESLSGGSP